ncbi:MAG: hypothetical protein AAGM36_12885, partial [Cyanobacteria bacterium J06597_1]
MAKRRSSRRKQPNTSNGASGANHESAAAEAAAPATPETSSAETVTPPTVTGAEITETVTAGENVLQRLQAVLADLDGKLALADRTLESLAEGIDFPEILGETLENLQRTVDQLKQQLPEAVRYNTESIVALHAQVAELETASAQSSDGGGTAIDGAAIAELRERIQALDDQLNDGDDGALQAAISECQQRIETELREREDIDAEVRSQLSKLEEQLVDSASLPAEILELPDTLTALQATVTELEARGNAAATGTEEIEASVRSIQSATESLEAQFAEAIANRSDDDWQAAMSELATRLDGLQQQLPEAVSINTQSIVSLTEQLTGIEAVLKQVSDADGGTEGLQTLVAELAAKLEGLQQQFPEAVSVNTQSIVSLTEQLGGFEATLQQVSEASSDTEAVQATVSELTTKLEALQQQLPEAVSVNTQSIVSLTEQLTGIDGVLKQVTETSKGDESKAAIAQLEQSIA